MPSSWNRELHVVPDLNNKRLVCGKKYPLLYTIPCLQVCAGHNWPNYLIMAMDWSIVQTMHQYLHSTCKAVSYSVIWLFFLYETTGKETTLLIKIFYFFLQKNHNFPRERHRTANVTISEFDYSLDSKPKRRNYHWDFHCWDHKNPEILKSCDLVCQERHYF